MTTHALLDELPSDFDYPDRAVGTVETSLGNGSSFRLQSGFISKNEMQRLIDDKVNLYLWSWVEYEGPTPGERYRSEFCAKFDFWGAASVDGLRSSYSFEGPFNGVDEHSYRPPELTTSSPSVR